MTDGYREYTVVEKTQVTPSTVCVRLVPKEGPRPDFIPGQFVNVLLPARGSEAKSYTLSSIPADAGLSLTVRAAGLFSQALVALGAGDTLAVSDPLGYFYPEDSATPRVCLAGGVGVAPFASFIRASVEAGTSPKTLLLYSSRSAEEILFADLFAKLAERAGDFSVQYFITREKNTLLGAEYERIGITHLAATSQTHAGAHYFLCGSIAFVRDMRLNLKSLNIPEESIFTEAFF